MGGEFLQEVLEFEHALDVFNVQRYLKSSFIYTQNIEVSSTSLEHPCEGSLKIHLIVSGEIVLLDSFEGRSPILKKLSVTLVYCWVLLCFFNEAVIDALNRNVDNLLALTFHACISFMDSWFVLFFGISRL